MGIESFYVRVVVKKEDVKLFIKEYHLNACYSKGLSYHLDDDDLAHYISLRGLVVSFLSASILIYYLCETLKLSTDNYIEANGIVSQYVFNNKIEFLCFLYQAYEKKIDGFYSQFGAFLLRPDKYYKSRFKLRKKYYVKINNEINKSVF